MENNKNFIWILVFSIITTISFVMAVNADNIGFKYGDVDCDGRITANDAALILNKANDENYQMPIEKLVLDRDQELDALIKEGKTYEGVNYNSNKHSWLLKVKSWNEKTKHEEIYKNLKSDIEHCELVNNIYSDYYESIMGYMKYIQSKYDYVKIVSESSTEISTEEISQNETEKTDKELDTLIEEGETYKGASYNSDMHSWLLKVKEWNEKTKYEEIYQNLKSDIEHCELVNNIYSDYYESIMGYLKYINQK